MYACAQVCVACALVCVYVLVCAYMCAYRYMGVCVWVGGWGCRCVRVCGVGVYMDMDQRSTDLFWSNSRD